jgi:hypothetical protein
VRIANDLIAAGRKAVLPRVRGYVTVSVSLHGELADGRRPSRPSHAGRTPGLILAVELAGPGNGPRDSARMMAVRQQIGVWHACEVVPAVCRIAERILREHPAWRRLTEPARVTSPPVSRPSSAARLRPCRSVARG